MCPIIVKPQTAAQVCSVSRAGIGMFQAVVDETGWKIGSKIQIAFIESVRCILLRSLKDKDNNNEGFKFVYSDHRHKTGGRNKTKGP